MPDKIILALSHREIGVLAYMMGAAKATCEARPNDCFFAMDDCDFLLDKIISQAGESNYTYRYRKEYVLATTLEEHQTTKEST